MALCQRPGIILEVQIQIFGVPRQSLNFQKIPGGLIINTFL